MAIIELSGSVLGLSFVHADLSGKFALVGAAAGKGTLRYGPKQRVLMDVEGLTGEIPNTDTGGVWSPIDAGKVIDGQVPTWDAALKKFVYKTPAGGGGGGSGVSSFNGRTGAVVPASGDYAVADVTGAAPLANPTFTGDPKAPTASPGDNDTSIATTAFVAAAASGLAPLASPTFTGDPKAPTPSAGDNDTSIATTAFVAAGFAPIASPTFTGDPKAPTPGAGDNDTSIATTAFVTAAVNAAVVGGIGSIPYFPMFDPDKPQGSPSAKDDEFDDSTGMSGAVNGLNARWSWVNQGGASVSFLNNKLYMTFPATTGDQWRWLAQTLPSTPYRIVARLSLGNTKLATGSRVGLGIRDGATSHIIVAGYNLINTGMSEGVSVASTATGGPTDRLVNANRAFGAFDLFVAITDDGTNLTVHFSRDGVGWVQAYTETRATQVVSPSQILIGGDVNNASAASLDLIVEFFRVLGSTAVPGGMRNILIA